jgi:divalent metal cation (Fe/Co/Zn/Cd) transporter
MGINTNFEFTTSKKNTLRRIILTVGILFLICISNICVGVFSQQVSLIVLGLSLSITIAYCLTIFFAESNKNQYPDYLFQYGYTKFESLFILVHFFLSLIIALITIHLTIISNISTSLIKIDKLLFLLGFVFLSSIIIIFLKKVFDRNLSFSTKNRELIYNFIVWKNTLIMFFVSFMFISIAILFYQADKAEFLIYLDKVLAGILSLYLFLISISNIKFAIDILIDKPASDEIQFNILSVVVDNIKNYCEFRRLQVRSAGRLLLVEIEVVLPYDFTIEQKYELEKRFDMQIKDIYSNSITRLYVIPCNKDCSENNPLDCPIRKLNK